MGEVVSRLQNNKAPTKARFTISGEMKYALNIMILETHWSV